MMCTSLQCSGDESTQTETRFNCNICERNFRSKRGLNQHMRSCSTKTIDVNEVENENNVSVPTDESNRIDEINDDTASTFVWGIIDGKTFTKNVNNVYEKIVYWKKNLFMLPTGKAGKVYIDEMTKLLNSWSNETSLMNVAFKALMIMPNLLLQKPSKTSKAKDHLKALERRLKTWKEGDVLELLREGETIQNLLQKIISKKRIAELSKQFASHMHKGNINAAIKVLTNNMKNGILPLNNETLKLLKQKHPKPTKADEGILLTDIPDSIHSVKFESIDEDIVRKAVIKTRGGAGPSSMDADGWRRIVLSKYFGDSSDDFCKALSKVIQKLCTDKSCSTTIESLMACRLIPLDKNPGLRPIGVGEVLRRIIGKVVTYTLRNDVIKSVGSLQVCAGHEAGAEAAIHAMHSIFEDESTEAVLLVDAANAFNSVNREAFINNIAVICPSLSIYVSNCYSIPSRLFVIGGFELKSEEGTTQGDPVAMAVYAIAIIPLLLMMMEIVSTKNTSTKAVAYADDFTSAGTLIDIKRWWDTLCDIGPKFGYHPQASKSYLIVKEKFQNHAENIFIDSNVQLTVTGEKHLGAVIGSKSYKENYVEQKVKLWIEEISMLSKIALTEPQAAYTCFTSGYKHKLTYLMRTIPNISELLTPLDEIILNQFIPSITGDMKCSMDDRMLLALHPKLGGLGIPIFSKISDVDVEYSNSKLLTRDLCDKIIRQEVKYEANNEINNIKSKITLSRQSNHYNELKKLRTNMNETQQRLNDINCQNGASIWLTSLPIIEEGYRLNKQQFTDAVRIRYGWALSRLPSKCVCGVSFNIDHALSCKKGGFVTLRHNEIRNTTAKLLKEVCHDVKIEPSLIPLTGETFTEKTANLKDDARLDVAARGFWISGQKAFFDVRVFNPFAKRYRNQEIEKCYVVNEKERNEATF